MLQFRPKLVDCLKGYDRARFFADLSAGLTVGVLALPLSMAFAIASGVSPAAGIWTGIVAGLLVAVFGGSRVQIGGPTGAFIPILYGIVVTYGVSNMLAATFLAGVLLLVMGITRLGNLIRFIPISVVIGFTNGIGVVLMLSQIKDFFGLEGGALPAEFFPRMAALWHMAPSLSLPATALALGTLLLIIVWSRLARRWRVLAHVPAQLGGLIVGTLIAVLLGLPVETIGSRFNGIPQGLPTFAFPLPDLQAVGRLLMPAVTIALLGAIESLLSARVVDPQIDDKHDPNQELMAQGIANIASPFFGGIAATGAIARTSTNVRAGGRTPVAGIVHSITLFLIVMVAAPLAAWVPIPVLAAIVVVTAIRMGEWHEFGRLKAFPWSYGVILCTTFLLTVLFDLTVAVEIGLLLACLFFIHRMQSLTELEPIESRDRGVAVFALRGTLFFGSVARLDERIDAAGHDASVLVFDMSEVTNIDATGADWLHGMHRAAVKRGGELILCSLTRHVHAYLARSGLLAVIGPHNACADQHKALDRAREVLGEID
ncbi:MAG: sodium-independent anion transporter [Candidatus Dactylopiibacterium carminicum]|uniref:Sodium-independent anion transporter n=1 Tax=Candidatus Dactylopiibacterium carminicum TaxID=857335 RepID=A0A272EN90_9RHOO|nr:SulP family inorganic anion transporter [Candidatus Dactylopiibacterium carminicum]KAF7597963.1 sodium-independent anion transporter [Candidatus Dactylopiibacterium carminicum]PAS91559.1 MAG: sodium-independent anion transporter [Candidatus Dactylopiibacterium carminicum]PAS93208.1 MAG: sodium-independent anion transporter [Candidatus Dactylopiibacterium carminicum]PAS96148.1 MAG: sodium-independent anion transporter [Candidatus Dactylopiibacterium carminicum]